MVTEPIQPAPGQLRRWLDELDHGHLNDDRNFLVVGRDEDFPTSPSETKPWWILVEGELVSWSYWMILEMSEVIGD